MPPLGLWPFIKEVLFNKGFTEYVKRNKLFSLLVIMVAILIILVLFITEQALIYQDKYNKSRLGVTKPLVTTDWETRYNECMARLAAVPICKVESYTTPTPKPVREKPRNEVALPHRFYEDDELRKKLDAIR